MAKSNRDRIGEGLDLLKQGLQPFIERELKSHYGKEWERRAAESLRHDPRQDGWDAAAILNVLNNEWHSVFRDVLGNAERTLAFEIRDVRNDWAHQKSFTSDDTYRALDSMSRLLQAVSAGEQAMELDQQKMEVMRLKFSEQTRHDARRRASHATEGKPAPGLTPWREVIEPHPDVAAGTYQQAEFAADLHQVFQGIASAEYGDATEFFRRTYLTEGLSALLTTAVKRLTKNEGDPVVALQTNFGGGKTHSLLSLFHLFDPDVKASELPHADELLARLEVESLPSVKRAVLVGHYIEPGRVDEKRDGTKVRTLWGELAWQLGAYDLVREADETGTNPGKRLTELFDRVGPCLILIDEWVAYARQLYEKHDLPAGSFDTQFTFAQALTEAAKSSKQTMLVVSVPASDIEKGGPAGREALARLEHVVSRTEATWQPASSEEGFEIVRRRLFKPIPDDEAFRKRDDVIHAFVDFYRSNSKEFPGGCGSADYEKRMKSAYPIHPEVFDRLYDDWSTLDRFQRTRGVLRLMASVIHELWERGDGNLMILPGMIPLDEPDVRKELTRYLEPSWQPVVESDVDGQDSTPLTIDQENNALGRYSATRRVARTVFLGTAPLKGTANRGKDIRQINLGSVQPGETLATFGDALRRLQTRATYLNTDGERSFYDTAQNINRDAESRKQGFSDEEVVDEIRQVLKQQERTRGGFAKVHACPQGPSDVADDREVRLVILGPESPHLSGSDETPAIEAAKELLESRGAGPRLYRNTLVFIAADQTRYRDLEDAVRWSMAWKQIEGKKEELDLNEFQRRTAAGQRKNWESTVEQRVPETYCWLIVPNQPDKHGTIEWKARRVSGKESLADRAARQLKRDEDLIAQLGAVRLRMELDRIPLWRGEDVAVRQLVDDFAQYLYLPRLASPQVLIDAIIEGVGLLSWKSDAFAYAEDKDEAGRYRGLRAGETIRLSPDSHGVVVQPDVAEGQRKREEEEAGGDEDEDGTGTDGGGGSGDGGTEDRKGGGTKTETVKRPRRFYGTVQLDPTRLGRDASRINEEVLTHLASLDGAKVSVTLEIHVETPGGVSLEIERAVSENCRTLGFEAHGFEQE